MTLRVLLAATLVFAGAAAVPAQTQTPAPLPFALIGDLGYSPAEEPEVDRVMAELNRASLAFVVHVGDLGSPRFGSCTTALWQKRLAQFNGSAHPLIYTPGDNDWTDCHADQGVANGDPLERLPRLRETFFPGPQSLGQRTIPLIRQSDGDAKHARFRENARWDFNGVTFVTLHVTGSNNGRGRNPEGDAEYTERNAAVLGWLQQAFEHARTNNSRAIMVIQQANLYPEFPPFPGKSTDPTDGLTEVRAALAKETIAFGKPVMLVHGDSHYFRVDKPLMRRVIGRPDQLSVENLTRLETFGSPFSHWVEVAIDPADPEVFVVRPRIVAGNVSSAKR